MKPTPKSLKNKIDVKRSIHVRMRDIDWKEEVRCFTCSRILHWKNMHAGHFHLRQHDWTTELGGDDRNIQAQCSGCNNYMRGRPQTFALNLVKKYGDSILQELQDRKDTIKKYKISDLEKLLKKYEST